MRIRLNHRVQFPFSILLAFTLTGASVPVNRSPENIGMQQIRAERLAAHVAFLANDLLEGRGTGTRGYNIAASYVANQFEELGLKPGGNEGSYLQQVPFRKADLIPDKTSMAFIRNGQTTALKIEEDFLMSEDYLRTESSVQGAAVFAGFGVTAPEFHYDDFAGIDAKGKVAVILSGSPNSLPLNEHAYYASYLVKEANLAQHGVIGYVVVQNPDDEKRRNWNRSVRQSRLPGFHWLQPDGTPSRALPQLKAHALMSHAGAEKLFASSPYDLKDLFQMWSDGKLRSFPLSLELKMETATTHEKVESPNIVGILPGSDARLKNEYIVYSAHVDHLGISDPVDGDGINNGAYDNGTGTAALIELARAFSKLSEPPRRSILFLGVTGEEKGLQGSDYFANHPTVPFSSIVADINTDMFLMLYPVADIVTIGAEHSSLGPVAAQAIAKVGLKASPDPFKQEVIFIRSDQYSFIRKGVPSVMLMTGTNSMDRRINGTEAFTNWLRTVYHSPQDDLSQHMNWSSGVKLVQAAFLTGLSAANAEKRPSWNSGDFFGEKFSH